MIIIPRYSKLTARSIHKTKKFNSFFSEAISNFTKVIFLFIGEINLVDSRYLFVAVKVNRAVKAM